MAYASPYSVGLKFMFFARKKPVVLTAYTDQPLLAELAAPKFARQKLPRYYKTMPHRVKKDGASACPVPHSLEYTSTIRQCYGIHKYNTAGILVPLWADYSIVSYQGDISCVGAKTFAEEWKFHSNNQAPGLLDPYNILKLESPWVFRCSDETTFAVLPNFYDMTEYLDKFTMPPAIDEYYNQSSTSFFLLFRKDLPDQEIFLKFGTPFMKIVPLTDRPVELKIQLVNNLTNYMMTPPKHFFTGSMAKLKQFAKQWNNDGD